MNTARTFVLAGMLALPIWVASAQAHVLPWRPGESRMKAVGKCAKGPCSKRYDFSEGRPHHHHGDRIAEDWVHRPGKCPL